MSLIGQTLGQYRILDEIGAGGMGVVYRAQDLTLGRHVALKLLPASAAGDHDAVERFKREARTASSLSHPNICTIYSFGEHEGQLLLAMELLEGEPLDRKLSGRALDLRTLIDLASQIADALDAAHGEGVLHRDIKPANIFLTRRGQVKILDFGLAKLAPDASRGRRSADSHATGHFSSRSGTTIGTIAYMSPEQARGEDLDARTDLFSFGVVLYEMATGRQSFPGNTTAVIFDGILNRDPAPPRSLNAAVPAELERIITKALEKDRGLRYQSAADMRADLQRLKRDSGSARPAVPVQIDPPLVETIVVPSTQSPVTAVIPPAASWAVGVAPDAVASGGTVAARKGLPTGAMVALILGSMAFLAVIATIGAFLLNAQWTLNKEPQPSASSTAPVTSPPVPAPSPATPPAAPTTAGTTASVGRPAPGAPTAAPPGAAPKSDAATPPVSRGAPRARATDAAAAERLDIARAKIASNLF